MKSKSLTAFFLLVVAYFFATWIYTAYEYDTQQHRSFPLLSVVCVIVILIVLFWFEGFEAAYGDLRDKDAEQVDSRIKGLLSEMQDWDKFFVGMRELYVVVGIAVIGFVTTFKTLYLPFWGVIERNGVPETFAIVFSSLIVFWFASVASKRLALENPQVFLRYSSFLWPLIRMRALTVFVLPAEMIVGFLGRRRPFSEKKFLLPSRKIYYETSLSSYGHSVDRVLLQFVIGPDGSCEISQKELIWVATGRKTEYSSGVEFPDAEIDGAEWGAIRVLKGPRTGATKKELYGYLDELFDRSAEGVWSEQMTVPVDPKFDPTSGTGCKKIKWTLKSSVELPEGLPGVENSGFDPARHRGALLLYEVSLKAKAGAFKLIGSDFWEQLFPFPSRRYNMILSLSPELRRYLAVPHAKVLFNKRVHAGETERLPEPKLESENRILKTEILFPLQGASHRLEWECYALQGKVVGQP